MSYDDEKLYSIEEVFPDFHIGHALRGLRYREDLTQKQLAKMVGVSPKYISEIENSKRSIDIKMAKHLAKSLRTDYRVFFNSVIMQKE